MGTKREIGAAIKGQLKSLNSTPSNQVWNKLEIELEKKKKRRVIPFWFWPAGIGILFLGFVLGGLLFNSNLRDRSSDSQDDVSIVDPSVEINKSQQESTKSTSPSLGVKDSFTTNDYEEKSNEIGLRERIGTEKNKVKTKTLSRKKTIDNTTKNWSTVAESQTAVAFKKDKSLLIDKIETVASNTIISKTEVLYEIDTDSALHSISDKIEGIVEQDVEKTKNDLIKQQQVQDKDSVIIIKKNPWSVSASGMINMYDVFKNESLIDKRLDGNQVDRNLKINYGIALHHNLFNKWTLRIGANLVNYDQLTRNIDPNTVNFQTLEHVSYKVDEQLLSDFIATSNNVEIRQDFTYLEIPIQARYSFVGNQIDLAGIIGFQNRLLLDDRIYLTSESRELQIGKSENIYNYGVSAHLSLASRVHLFKKFYFNVEPAIYYHLQPFETDGVNLSTEFRVTTSLEYKF